MNIVIFSHPRFLPSQSMPRFVSMLRSGFLEKGHIVDIWMPQPFFYRIPVVASMRKWFGYIDQYLLFPIIILLRLLITPKSVIFIFADQALGPWLPLVKHRPHVVHVHDFMALRSALGEVPQNPTSWTGKQYQAMIRRGFSHGKNFISVSENTQNDLVRFIKNKPIRSEVVYNGLNYPFARMTKLDAVALLANAGFVVPMQGFLLHVGGNQWYKNRIGVVEIYKAYALQNEAPLPLLMIGEIPTKALTLLASQITGSGRVVFLSGLSNETVCAAYSCARLLVFPSLAEGFGWPIAEAMACGCLVLTTFEAPMTEVGGEAAFYIPAKPSISNSEKWAEQSGGVITQIINMSEEMVLDRQKMCLQQSIKFGSSDAISAYEKIYLDVIADNLADINHVTH